MDNINCQLTFLQGHSTRFHNTVFQYKKKQTEYSSEVNINLLRHVC